MCYRWISQYEIIGILPWLDHWSGHIFLTLPFFFSVQCSFSLEIHPWTSVTGHQEMKDAEWLTMLKCVMDTVDLVTWLSFSVWFMCRRLTLQRKFRASYLQGLHAPKWVLYRRTIMILLYSAFSAANGSTVQYSVSWSLKAHLQCIWTGVCRPRRPRLPKVLNTSAICNLDVGEPEKSDEKTTTTIKWSVSSRLG